MTFSRAAAALACTWICLALSPAIAAPVAVNDNYDAVEDTPLAVSGSGTSTVFAADFEATSSNYASGSWDFLDAMQNQFGTDLTYPVDGSARSWKDLNFELTTSTVGPWKSHVLPIQGGGLTALPSAAELLAGIGGGAGGENVVTTYLFRKVITLDAATAAINTWTAHLLVDDGCIIYANGQEVGRLNMDPANYSPAGSLTSNTFTTSGNESAYSDVSLDMTGKLVPGQNVIAIEVHQTASTSSDAGIDLTLSPTGADPTDGFLGVDDAFYSTNRPTFENQTIATTGGYNGTGGARVVMGNISAGDSSNKPTSSAWRRTFVLSSAASVQVSFRYRLLMAPDFEANATPREYGEAIFDLDGTQYGTTHTPSSHLALDLFEGNGNGGGSMDTGWKTASYTISLGAGSHTMSLGGYLNSSTQTDGGEQLEVFYDDVEVLTSGTANGLLSNDTGGAVSAQLVSTTSHGNLNLSADGTFTYIPEANFVGTDAFTYKASDGTSQSNTATVTITVGPINDSPVAVVDSYSVNEDGTLTVTVGQGVLANDVDVDNASLTALLGTTTGKGTLNLAANGSFTYTPGPDFFGTDTFTYQASDGAAASAAVTVTITVNPVNDPPVGQPDSYRVSKNTPLAITQPDGISLVEDLVLGAVRDGSNNVTTPGSLWKYWDKGALPQGEADTTWRTLAYDDAAWLEGASELGYGDTPPNDNFPEVTLIEDNPTPGYTSVTDRYWTAYFRKKLTILNASEITAVNLQVLRDDGAVFYINGLRAFRSNIATTTPVYSTAASNGSNQEETFLSAADTNFNLDPAPSPAIFVEGENILAAELHQDQQSSSDLSFDAKLSITRLTNAGLLRNDSDADGDTLTAEAAQLPAHGTVTVNPDGTFTYTPTLGYQGTDSFTYVAKDGSGQSAPITVSLTIIPGGNVAPVTTADAYDATEDETLTISAAQGVLANDLDPDGDPFTAVVLALPTKGSLTLNEDGSFVYVPNANANGTDTFTYRASDGFFSQPTTVTITIAPTPDAPVAVADAYSGDPGLTLTVTAAQGVLANDTDPDGDTLTATLISAPATGSLTLNANGSFTFVPVSTGVVTFSYRATDGVLNSPAVTVTIILNAAPVVVAESYSTAEDTALTVGAATGLLSNDSDPEGSPLTAAVASQPASGAVTVNADGSFTYTPNTNYNGTDSFTYRASDGVRTSAPATVTVIVTPVNDPPTALNDNYTVGQNETATVIASQGVLANDTDPDSTGLTATLVAGGSHGQVTLNADGSFSYVPDTNYSGLDSFTYRASDGSLNSSSATVVVQVVAGGDFIIITEIMYSPPGGATNNEFIEICNTASYTINLSGWRFASGVDYVFPNGTLIPGGGYLVVPADAAVFQATYPAVTNFVSPGWGILSNLANKGETVRLKDSADREVDQVDYSDEAEWSQRRTFTHSSESGLEWWSQADPDPDHAISAARRNGGQSLQVKNHRISNNNGHNWAAGVPTPGAANVAVAETESAPLIKDVVHSPAIPTHLEQVRVVAKVTDESSTGLVVNVNFRTWSASATSPDSANFTVVQMVDDGLHGDGLASDGEFGASIPAQASGKVVEFYVSAADGGNRTRTWPAPAYDSAGANPTQSANCLYQVDETSYTREQPIYRLIMTGKDNNDFLVGNWSSSSDASLNCTLIVKQGLDTDVRYECGVRVRGSSSRSWNPRNWRLEIPHGRDWNGRTAFNLNTKYVYSQYLGGRLFECAGLPSERPNLVAVWLNGTDHSGDGSNASGNTRSYGFYVDNMPIASEMIAENFPLDDSGNSYKKERAGAWSYSTSADPATYISTYRSNNWTKNTNSLGNDWSDLHAWLTAVNVSTTASFDTSMADTVNLDEWAKFFAICTILNHQETSVSNGDDDDYSIYFTSAPDAKRRCSLLIHDLDTIFSIGEVGSGATATATIYQATDGSYCTSPTIPQMDKFYQNNVCNRKFKAAMRKMLTTFLSQPSFDAMVNTELKWMVDAGSSIPDTIKASIDGRRTYLLGLLNTPFTATTTLTQQSGYYRTTSATDLGSLGGSIDAASTAKVTVNGTVVSHSNYNVTWTADAPLSLAPGINRVVCQAWDENDKVIGEQILQIWYDDSTVSFRSGTITTAETWAPAGGPFSVSLDLTIGNGGTLTIQPGTNVYIAAGRSIYVTGTGKLIVQGTPTSRVRFGSTPSSTPTTWGGIVFNGSTASENRLTNVEIDNAAGVTVNSQTAKVHVINSTATLDRVTFTNSAAAQYLNVENSSFLVTGCTFPSYPGTFNTTTAPTMVRCAGLPLAGSGVIRDNVFGHTWGANDTIKFIGGQRPNAIWQIIGNTFDGGTDEILDLEGADAWIEGNTFAHVHQDTQRASSADSANAIGGSSPGADSSEWTIVNNRFYDIDHAVLAKGRTRFAFLRNTVAHVHAENGNANAATLAAFNFSDDGAALSPLADGQGALIDDNIIVDCPLLLANYSAANLTVSMNGNLLPQAWAGPGTGNTVGVSPLNVTGISAPLTAPMSDIQSALRAGTFGPTVGGGWPVGILSTGAPLSPSNSLTPSLTPGPSGSFVAGSAPAFQFGWTAYKYSLDGVTFSAETPISTPISLTGLENGLASFYLLGKNDAGGWQTTATHSPIWLINDAAPTVVISEILAENAGAYTLGSTLPDFVELHNYGASTVSLTGMSLSDDPASPGKYKFPAGASIAPGGYLLVIADILPSQAGELHCGFGLDAGGETVGLYGPKPAGGVAPQWDSVTFGPQLPSKSVSRLRESGIWGLSEVTAGAANIPAAQALGSGANLVINEWLSTNYIVVDADFVELFNPGSLPVALAGYALTDDYTNFAALKFAGAGSAFVLPPLSFIPAGGFVKFRADGNANDGPDHMGFKLSKLHESLALMDPAGNRLDHVIVAPSTEDKSQGRSPDGSLVLAYFTTPTPGLSNGTNVTDESMLMNNLRITEIMFDPTSSSQAEFIEFKNISAAPLLITGVHFASGITFDFPAMTLAAGGYAVITNDLAKFHSQFPAVAATQWTDGKLANEGENLRIETPVYGLGILDFSYQGDWYLETSGGASLEIIDATAARHTWDLRESWQVCVPSPGGPSAFGVLAGLDTTAVLPAAAALNGLICYGQFSPGGVILSWSKESGPGTVSFSAPASKTTDVTFSAPGTYVLKLTANAGGINVVSDTVQVVAAESYSSWAARTITGSASSQQGTAHDPDRDGVPNLVEYATGSNPLVPGASLTVHQEANHLVIRYNRSKSIDPAVLIIPEISWSLDNWQSGDSWVTSALEGETTALEFWRAEEIDIIGSTAPQCFLRLRVVAP